MGEVDEADAGLDDLSADLIRGESGATSLATLTNLTLAGDADIDALVECFVELQAERPETRSLLVEKARGSGWSWKAEPEPKAPLVVDLSGTDATSGADSVVIDAVYDRGRRPRDLTCERPFRASIVTLSGDRLVLAFETHHALGDAAYVLGMIADLLARYHRRVEGIPAPWSAVAPSHNVMSASAPRIASRLELVRYLRRIEAEFPGSRTAAVAGERSDQPAQVLGQATIDDREVTGLLRARARAAGATLTDLMTASAMVAVCEWNEERAADAEVQRFGLAVSRRTAEDSRHGNRLSGLLVGCTRDEIADPSRLVVSLARQRRSAHDAGIDLRLMTMARRLKAVSRHFPGGRFPLVKADGVRSRLTMTLSNPGIMWPEVVDGRPTGSTAIDHAGGLRLVGHAALIGVGSALRPALIVATLDGRLMISVVSDQLIHRESEAGELAEAIRANTLALL